MKWAQECVEVSKVEGSDPATVFRKTEARGEGLSEGGRRCESKRGKGRKDAVGLRWQLGAGCASVIHNHHILQAFLS